MSENSVHTTNKPSSSAAKGGSKPHWFAKTLCKFYSAGKHCPHKKCNFLHESKPQAEADIRPTASGKTKEPTPSTDTKNNKKKKNKTLCRYFKAGYCKDGHACQFKHAKIAPEPKNQQATDKTITATMVKIQLADVSADELAGLRATEIKQMKKRYPNVLTVDGEDCDGYQFTFTPTDPDWPYDVKELPLIVRFPALYPKQMMVLELAEDGSTSIPETVRSCVQNSLEKWLKDKEEVLRRNEQTQLLFRPFLNWLDRTLETIFTKGLIEYKKELVAKQAGLQFIHPDQLRASAAAAATAAASASAAAAGNSHPASNDAEETDDSSDSSDDTDDSAEGGSAGSTDSETVDTTAEARGVDLDPERRGTEVKLINLAMSETVATLVAERITIMLQCGRCQNRLLLTTPASRLNSISCDRCHTFCQVMLRSSVMHSFSSVLGYLDLEGCTPFDMVLAECHFALTCLDCSHQQNLQGLPAGQQLTIWCRHCHQKLVLAVNSVRFLQLQPSRIADKQGVHVEIKKSKPKAVKDASIVVGTPLPANGTCKHYKKSFRWMRFPCCGKLYPCDLCHEEKEHDHEMKLANRIVCGFCSKEQPSHKDNVCIACHAATTKKSSGFWEGGKGCRNKVKMSRSDGKKYADTNKTISRHAQEQQKSGRQKSKK